MPSEVVAVLRRSLGAHEALDYMAAMVEEEVKQFQKDDDSDGQGGRRSLSPSDLEALLGSFIADAGLDVTSVSKAIAAELNTCIATKAKSTDKPSAEGSNVFGAGGFTANAFLAETSKWGFEDPFLGLKKVNVNFNSDVPIDEALKMQAAQAKAREAQMRRMRDWERQRQPLPPPCKYHGDAQREKLTDIVIPSFSVAIAGRELLYQTALRIALGRKYGLIGRNGIGKSTFISALVRKEIQGLPKDVTIGCVEQELDDELLEKTPLQCVLEVDAERTRLLEREAHLLESQQSSPNDAEATGKALTAVYSRMHDIDAAGAPAEASSILAGLQFTPEMQGMRVRDLSGGWRVRVALARALFATADIVCLDEPTNHLDLHAVAWLTNHLQSNMQQTCIIVSHSRSFLNDVCTDIIDFRDKKLHYYRGDFNSYEKAREESLRLQQRRFEAQQLKRDHVQKFIDRFRAKTATAAMVQSRIKALEKLPMLEAVTLDPSLSFDFKTPEQLPMPILQISSGYFSYKVPADAKSLPSDDSSDWILKDVDLNIDFTSRIAIAGVNGSGKTTLLKMLCGTLNPQKGHVSRNGRLRIGFFSQHFVDSMDLTLNAVQLLQTKYPNPAIKDEDARTFLGGFGISGLLALEPLYVLSGGQKSRVAIALVAYNNPHILILDEPTNHLDLDAIQALIAALNAFDGGVVVVSHDTHLLSCVTDEVYYVSTKQRRLVKFAGSIDEYKRNLLKNAIV